MCLVLEQDNGRSSKRVKLIKELNLQKLMAKKDVEDSIYEEENSEELEESDEITPEEEGFMNGYNKDEESNDSVDLGDEE